MAERPIAPDIERMRAETPDKPEGPISAAIIAGGIGTLILGILTTVAEASESFKEWLELDSGVGSLSGKTTFAVAGWLVAWAILHVTMKDKRVETRGAFITAMILVAIAVVLTFPTFFQAFASE